MAAEPEVTRANVVRLNDKIRSLEERLSKNSIESTTYQEELLARLLSEK